MPLIVKDHLPAVKALEEEGLFTATPERALTQDIRPLKIALVNLMPTKTTTEIQFMRLLSNSPLQIEFTLLCMGSHRSKNTSDAYLKQFYKTLIQIEGMRFDGMIITGAPVENLDFKEVDYWYELKELMRYTKCQCFFNPACVLGGAGGFILSLWDSKISVSGKMFWCVSAHHQSEQ